MKPEVNAISIKMSQNEYCVRTSPTAIITRYKNRFILYETFESFQTREIRGVYELHQLKTAAYDMTSIQVRRFRIQAMFASETTA